MKWWYWLFADYAFPLLIAGFLGFALFVSLLFRREIAHAFVMGWRWIKAYAVATRVTFKQERSRSREEKRLERLERKAEKAIRKRDAARVEKFGASIERMMRK